MTNLIEDHLKRCRLRFSRVTCDDREELLRRLDAELPLGVRDATTEDLQDWLAQPKKRGGGERSRKTLDTYLDHIFGFYRDPAVAEEIGWDPSAGLIRPKVPDKEPIWATEDEVRYAIANLPRPYDLYAMLAGDAGLRAGEIARLYREHVTEDRVTIYEGKGGKTRTVPTHPELWKRIRLVQPGTLYRNGRAYSPIALLESGNVMTPTQMSLRMSYRLTRIGLPDLTLHSFRRRFASMMLRPRELGGAGADLLTVSILMGHANPNTTKIYCQITDGQRRLAVHALPAVAPVSR